MLTCIIGGKSTGKSLLLHNLAYYIDEAQVNQKCKLTESRIRPIERLDVYWRDGYTTLTKTAERKIIYIPQTYLNRLSDEKEETTEIDIIIRDILLQNPQINEEYDKFTTQESDYKSRLDKMIYDYVSKLKTIKKISQIILEIGSPESIETEINRLKDIKDSLIEKGDISEEDVKIYDNTLQSMNKLSDDIDILSADQTIIESINKLDVSSDFIPLIKSKYKDEVSKIIAEIKEDVTKQWLIKRSSILEKIQLDISQLNETVQSKKSVISELKPKIENNEQMKEINAKIAKEEDKLRRSKEYYQQLRVEKKNAQVLLLDIINSRKYYHKLLSNFASFVNSKQEVLNVEDIEFKLDVVFRKEKFIEMLKRILDNRSISRFTDYDLRNLDTDDYSDDMLLKLCNSIIDDESPTSLELKQNYTLEESLRQIFQNWYNISYVVTMDNDEIYYMSPGKKALVLLKLLIGLAQNKCPILIDQPEDDLDNRSIFEDLVKYIRARKKERQIIIVTHNANIVIGGDAEQVIIANQDGKNAPNKEYRFEYRAGAIENDRPVYTNTGAIEDGILNQKGIQTQICEILEGGKTAFELRKKKYYSI